MNMPVQLLYRMINIGVKPRLSLTGKLLDFYERMCIYVNKIFDYQNHGLKFACLQAIRVTNMTIGDIFIFWLLQDLITNYWMSIR